MRVVNVRHDLERGQIYFRCDGRCWRAYACSDTGRADQIVAIAVEVAREGAPTYLRTSGVRYASGEVGWTSGEVPAYAADEAECPDGEAAPLPPLPQPQPRVLSEAAFHDRRRGEP